jgi:ferredoxin/flavodoxin---NADP+ reductase
MLTGTAEDKFYRATILTRKEFAPDLWAIRIRPGGPFSFRAGQYATLGALGPLKMIERAYSIVSSPYEPELEFFFELVPQGGLTPLLYKLYPGDQVSMRKTAKGRFVLDLQSARTHHLLVATVTGIAPYVSYVRTLYRDWRQGSFSGDHNLYMLVGASRPWEFGYREELERVAAEVPWLKLVSTVSRPWDAEDWRGEVGRVDELVRKYADMWQLTASNTTAYLCGHPLMIEHCKGILQRTGFAKENVKEEIYWIPAKAEKASGE